MWRSLTTVIASTRMGPCFVPAPTKLNGCYSSSWLATNHGESQIPFPCSPRVPYGTVPCGDEMNADDVKSESLTRPTTTPPLFSRSRSHEGEAWCGMA